MLIANIAKPPEQQGSANRLLPRAVRDFRFDFAGQQWDSFYVSRHGLVTFSESLPPRTGRKFETVRTVAAELATRPTISALFKHHFGGLSKHDPFASQHIAHWPDRVVITWSASESSIYLGTPTGPANRFQAVLWATGDIQFNYSHVTVGDGVVGLFSGDIVKGDLIATIVDATDSALPGGVDLLEAALYTTNTTTELLLEVTTRAPMSEGSFFRFAFDTDLPYWNRWSSEDADLILGLDFLPNGEVGTWSSGQHLLKFLARDHNQVRLLILNHFAAFSASILAGVGRTDDYTFTDTSIAAVHLPQSTQIDLSHSDGRFSQIQSEAFYYRGVPDLADISCRVIDLLGDGFDLFVFHSEIRLDPFSTPWRNYGNGVQGVGTYSGDRTPPCGDGRLLGHWAGYVWMPARVLPDGSGNLDPDLSLFAHEFIHTWTAGLAYEKNGIREPLFDDRGVQQCRCHWRPDLHTPAAFPWRGEEAQSIMGGGFGRFWRDNNDGTFTAIENLGGSGPSWLDLYAMGLADASEVPDMFILRNLQPVLGNDEAGWSGQYWGTYRGDKEVISIAHVVAAEGPRAPAAAEAQKDFNAGFVYFLEAGEVPDPSLLRLHREYRDQVIEHWSHITGGRSRMTTTVPGAVQIEGVLVQSRPD